LTCAAKNIPNTGWSNLDIDIMHNGLGVEQKMLCKPSKKSISEYCGTRQMHPSATRSIRIPSKNGDPTEIARDVLSQYAKLINERRNKVAENTPDVVPDIRTGWLLWQTSLREFLYFEEEMLSPNPLDFWAEWKKSGGGSRKKSVNLWVYEKESGRKRYSITTEAGAKIQPYFDIPPPNDPNLFIFTVQGELIGNGLVRIWVTSTTTLFLKHLIGNLNTETLSNAITKAAQGAVEVQEESTSRRIEEAFPLILTQEAYDLLCQTFQGISDEYRIQLLLQYLQT